MSEDRQWRAIVASALDWEQSHVRLEGAVEGLPAELLGRRPTGLPNSIWEIVEHVRRMQRDLYLFCSSDNYVAPKSGADYWPPSAAPESEAAWRHSLANIREDRAKFAAWTVEANVDLPAKIPHGTGQTYLRTVLVAVDHTAYHVGQIVWARRLLGAWPVP